MTAAVIEQIQNINPNVIFLDVNTNIRGCNIYIGGKSAVVNLDGKIVLRKDDLREDGYIAQMKMHNLDQYCHIFTANWSADEALEATNQLLQLKDRPTAIVVASDPMALGVYKALNDANVNIPNDISVASFDDVEINRFLTPTLSSIDMNNEGNDKTNSSRPLGTKTIVHSTSKSRNYGVNDTTWKHYDPSQSNSYKQTILQVLWQKIHC